ncbi:ribosome silencing factor [Thermosediminibacter oceani]|uniref:Ribosomal silencing factor RsfS n=1 Tax=Thermosediminibacter oceani (strain ATCC BAA-1034 / DSM 16646 / JW/IW-1228P) TaxID=555079 RepID=D9S2B0_THEOJ|nr:ribosome silencing factor [Thermosediminibacter oceani]ADL07537.1 iojap-like protein [Thermosediminibacter oceani DSM 16646]
MIKNPKDVALLTAKILSDKKAEDIVVLDISSISVIADYFVVATGRSSIHVKALADEVEEKLSEKGFKIMGKEGYEEARWILLDFADVVVHIFDEEAREYYDLERLWADAVKVDIDSDMDFAYNKQ